MMKQLRILISFFFIIAVEAQTISYEIKEGDTLYSIAKNNNISINQILNANERLGFSPDKILAGNIIFLPSKRNKKFERICFSKLGFQQVNIYKTPKEVASDCVDHLLGIIDINAIKVTTLSDEEILYLINKIYLDFDIFSYTPDETIISKSKEAQLLISAAKNGDVRATYAVFELLPGKFSDYLIDNNLLSIIDSNQDFDKRKNSCSSFNKNSKYNNYDILLYFYSMCADIFFDDGDNDYVKYDNLLVNLIFNNQSEIIKIFELYAITSMSYRKIYINDDLGALQLTNDFIVLKCPNCESSMELTNKYKESQFIEENIIPYTGYLTTAFFYFILNDTSAFFRYNGTSPENIIFVRNDIIDVIKKIMINDPNNIFGIKDAITAITSDTAILLMDWQKCDDASKFLDAAIEDYRSEYDNTNQDYFIEPLILSSCYIQAALMSGDLSVGQGYLDKAKKYRDISKDVMYELDVSNPVWLSLMSLVNLYLDYEFDDDGNYNLAFVNEFKELSNSLSKDDIFRFSGDLEAYELIVGMYTQLFFQSDYLDRIDTSMIIDPVTLLEMKERFFIASKLTNLKVKNTNFELKKLQSKLIDNNKKIKTLPNNDIEYTEMLKMYKDNANLIEEIFALNNNLKKFTSPDYKDIESISSSLGKNEFAYFLIPSAINSKVLLISSDSYEYWSIPSYSLIKPLLSSFIEENMKPNSTYDFKKAKLLGSYLFPMLEKEQVIKIDKGSTIYIYTDNLIGVPPGVFVSSYNDSTDISDYERLISANWFINDYNFTTRLNYEGVLPDFDQKPFLGIGNSSSYKWVGLPDLTEVNSEITNLALTSLASKDDVLINNKATKELFLDKLNQKYSRIVISTHSVPPNWQGLIEEPALVFNSNFGDYFLSPSEIINMDLNTDMVVLSSCNASIEGFDDLYKSFLIAGSNSVVHSNWNLESKYASRFTSDFFKELWLNDSNKHEAIRNVSLKFLNDYSNQIYAHPAYWGNFSIVYSN